MKRLLFYSTVEEAIVSGVRKMSASFEAVDMCVLLPYSERVHTYAR
jgi:hypothetical protein